MAIHPITLHTPTPEEAPIQNELNEALVRELLHRTRSASVALLLATLGLHHSACAARELKGNLTARSAGPGRGAAFLLALPFAAPVAA